MAMRPQYGNRQTIKMGGEEFEHCHSNRVQVYDIQVGPDRGTNIRSRMIGGQTTHSQLYNSHTRAISLMTTHDILIKSITKSIIFTLTLVLLLVLDQIILSIIIYIFQFQ